MSAAFDVPAGLGSGLSDDDALELEIESARRFGTRYAEEDPELSREIFKIMAMLVAKRSLARVERMEREKGLR